MSYSHRGRVECALVDRLRGPRAGSSGSAQTGADGRVVSSVISPPSRYPAIATTHRRTFPKGTDFAQVTDDQIRYALDNFNDKVRKTLGWKTPTDIRNTSISTAPAT